ncbi:hypothetical protein ACQKMD_12605 [Viridibacillus sp. NPDC096237]|uniref:hypothetical protein n=1 Tax=Viridibacillus sp. NPDC096237 TaxID=3390721 RepID=UPI003D0127D4
MKKIYLMGSLCLSFIFILMFNVGNVSAEKLDNNTNASSVKDDVNSYTLAEVEKIIEDYLESNGKNFDPGSPQYSDFIFDQYLNGANPELANRDDYQAIAVYLSEYQYQLLLQEEKSPSNLISIGSKLYPAKFDLGKIKDLTIGELNKQILEEEAAAEILNSNIKYRK